MGDPLFLNKKPPTVYHIYTFYMLHIFNFKSAKLEVSYLSKLVYFNVNLSNPLIARFNPNDDNE